MRFKVYNWTLKNYYQSKKQNNLIIKFLVYRIQIKNYLKICHKLMIYAQYFDNYFPFLIFINLSQNIKYLK